ncbi:MAG: helix-turn-helix transcriptional regulator [Leuconostoc pseudomesenteroides]|uniref:helix-turn-helix domain-containing protein n=1 Tax=Leuconostoc pseudomesenteroides TaxID=33968 RepID=UPI0039E742CE|nr:XRE family transcriptional regulator [Leuconostoc pseudomesenteroides]
MGQIYHGTGWLTIRKINTATIYNLKNGKVTNIRFSTMETIADALNISLDEFREREDVYE